MALQGQTTLTDAEKVTEARKHVDALVARVPEMSESEAQFITRLAGQFKQFGARTSISNKQLFWLRDIRMKY